MEFPNFASLPGQMLRFIPGKTKVVSWAKYLFDAYQERHVRKIVKTGEDLARQLKEMGIEEGDPRLDEVGYETATIRGPDGNFFYIAEPKIPHLDRRAMGWSTDNSQQVQIISKGVDDDLVTRLHATPSSITVEAPIDAETDDDCDILELAGRQQKLKSGNFARKHIFREPLGL